MTEYETVTMQTAWTEAGRGVLRAEGADARKWLHKIVTANVEQLETGRGAHGALLDAKGHFVADFILLRDGDIYGLLCEPTARENLFDTLKRYIIRDKVTCTDVTAKWTCAVILGNEAAAVVERIFNTRTPQHAHAWTWGEIANTRARIVQSIRARVPSFDVMLPTEAMPTLRNALQDVAEISDEGMETLRIEAGLPKWGVDFDATTLALEIPDVLQIRVDQGCYVGQEVVARIVHRGHVNRHLRGLLIEGDSVPARGQAILFDGKEVGSITSCARSPLHGVIALGYVRREVEPGASVRVNGTSARVTELPFALP